MLTLILTAFHELRLVYKLLSARNGMAFYIHQKTESNISVPLLVLAFMFGSVLSSEMHVNHHQAEAVLIPLYTLLVVLYLTVVGYRKHLEPILPPYLRSLQSHQKEAAASRDVVALSTRDTSASHVAASPIRDNATNTTEGPPDEGSHQPVDVSGVYKLSSNKNFEKFLEAQGVPFVMRHAANGVKPTHHLTHRGNQLTIKVTGIIESQTIYTIGGPPVETDVRGRIFRDQVTYLQDPNKKGVVVTKMALAENYTVRVIRELLPSNDILMTSTVTFPGNKKDPVTCTQHFKRID